MELYFLLICGVIAAIVIFVLLVSYICYRLTFFSNRKKQRIPKEGEVVLPSGAIYENFREDITKWNQMIRSFPFRDVEITSFDGLKLRGRYFEKEKGAPVELLMHGYRGESIRDLSGGVFRCFSLGRNVLLVDHRASGRSEGKVITFGINESRDCADWVKFIVENIDENADIFIGGISMGASTVLLATARGLHENVVGVLADCGYSSAKRIIKKVIRELHLPASLCYPLVKLGARLYGHFDLEEISPEEAMKTCHVPVFFVHGDGDKFVPFEMSVENYNACASEHKTLLNIEGVGHGLAFPAAQERYINEVRDFFDRVLGSRD